MRKGFLVIGIVLLVLGVVITTYPVGEYYGGFQESYIETETRDHIPVSATLEPLQILQWTTFIPESGPYDQYWIKLSISSSDYVEIKIYFILPSGGKGDTLYRIDKRFADEVIIYSENATHYIEIRNKSSPPTTISVYGDIYVWHKITRFQKGAFWLSVGFSLIIIGAVIMVAGAIISFKSSEISIREQ